MRTWKARFDTTRHGRFVPRGSDVQTSDTEALDQELFDLVDGPSVVVPGADVAVGATDPVTDALKLAEVAPDLPKPEAGPEAAPDGGDAGKSGAKGTSKK